MSSDYLEDVKDHKGNSIHLQMRARGFAELITFEADELCEDQIIVKKEGEIVRFELFPDEKGWKNAETIADALKDWIQHTKRLTGSL
jgi:hypothetical protein